jgi:DNA-binding NarL/FixJ family response regulator
MRKSVFYFYKILIISVLKFYLSILKNENAAFQKGAELLTYFTLTQNLSGMPIQNYDDFLSDLTITERKVLVLVVKGLTNQEIAKELFNTEGTIKKHREHIYRKAHLEGTREIRRFTNEIRPYLT